MEEEILIPAIDFCTSHRVKMSLIQALKEQGLVEIVTRKQLYFIPENQVKKLEQIIVFHTELEINLEGIETIFALLQRLESMQEHIQQLENKLQRFL
jgi:MerR family transcriptional regulator/heat shock protein HspR